MSEVRSAHEILDDIHRWASEHFNRQDSNKRIHANTYWLSRVEIGVVERHLSLVQNYGMSGYMQSNSPIPPNMLFTRLQYNTPWGPVDIVEGEFMQIPISKKTPMLDKIVNRIIESPNGPHEPILVTEDELVQLMSEHGKDAQLHISNQLEHPMFGAQEWFVDQMDRIRNIETRRQTARYFVETRLGKVEIVPINTPDGRELLRKALG